MDNASVAKKKRMTLKSGMQIDDLSINVEVHHFRSRFESGIDFSNNLQSPSKIFRGHSGESCT